MKNYVLALLVVGSLHAAAREKTYTEITRDNLAELAQIPGEWQDVVTTWESEERGGTSRKDMLRNIAKWRGSSFGHFAMHGWEFHEDLKELEIFGHATTSKHSYVFQGICIDNVGHFWIRIAGKRARHGNLREAQGRFYITIPNPLIDFDAGYCEALTYQTASSVADGILVRDVITKGGLTCMVAPECYLVRLNPDSGIEDNNTYAMHKHVDHFTQLSRAQPTHCALLDSMPCDMVRQMYIIAKNSGALWDKGNIGFSGDIALHAGKFAHVDLEQPHKTEPSAFYRRNKEKVALHRRLSLQNFCHLFSPLSEAYKQLMALIDADADLLPDEKKFVRTSLES